LSHLGNLRAGFTGRNIATYGNGSCTDSSFHSRGTSTRTRSPDGIRAVTYHTSTGTLAFHAHAPTSAKTATVTVSRPASRLHLLSAMGIFGASATAALED